MIVYTKAKTALIFIFLLVISVSCQRGPAYQIGEHQRQEIKNIYGSIQKSYLSLTESYKNREDSLTDKVHFLYQGINKMHEQMDVNHSQMMAQHSGGHMRQNGMMSPDMIMHMQNHMTGEWYSQMVGMHNQLAQMHQRLGQPKMAHMNRQLSEQFNQMRNMIPGLDEPSDVPFNEKGNPELVNGKRLYAQNCSSCHGNYGDGIGDAFPPLVNSKWITENKSTPIRIVMHGMSGKIEVDGQMYDGMMPSFKARLSASEIAAILNFLRRQSDGEFEDISQQDIITIGEKYRNRTAPWSAKDFLEE